MEDLLQQSDQVSLLRRQDPAAFTALVRDHEQGVRSLARSMGLGGADLEDAAADAFTEVFKALPKFEGRSAIGSWVYQIATRAVWRVRSRRKSAHAALNVDIVDKAASPARQAETGQQKERIWAAVAKLDARQATAIELFYGQDFSVDQIADVLQCPVGTVKTLLFRARAALRTTLKEV